MEELINKTQLSPKSKNLCDKIQQKKNKKQQSNSSMQNQEPKSEPRSTSLLLRNHHKSVSVHDSQITNPLPVTTVSHTLCRRANHHHLLPPCEPPSTIRNYTFNIGYLGHSTSALKPMLKVMMLNVSSLTSVLKNRC